MNSVNRGLRYALIVFACGVQHVAVRAQTAIADDPFGDGPAVRAEAVEKSIVKGGTKVANSVASETEGNVDDFCQCIGGSESSNSVVVKKIERVLKGPLNSSGLNFTETPLHDVVSRLQEEYGIPIQIDRPALGNNGIPQDHPLTVNINNVSVRAALRLMLKSINLTFVIQDEVLLITTPDQAERTLRVCVYDVGSIVGTSESQVDSIIDTLQSCVATETWSENGGGEARIRPIKPGLLVISQTARVHEEIRDLLATIRNVRSNDAAAEHEHAGHEHAAVEEVVTRSYMLQLNPPEDIDTMRSLVRELITGALPDEVWSGRLGNGQAVTLTVFHDRVVVRQTPGVQDKVAKILADSGVATPAVGGTGEIGPGGGFGGGGRGGGFFSRHQDGGAEPLGIEKADPMSSPVK